MNYLETGLPHTDFSPRKTNFRPPRYIPLCSLGRKYLGLEPLSRDEVQKIISRLCQPKQIKQELECEVKSPREDEFRTNQNRRFVGRKRMSSLEIEKMVERLYSQRKTKDFQFVENTFDTKDFINMTDRDESDDENNDDDVFNSKTEKEHTYQPPSRLNDLDKDTIRVVRPNIETNRDYDDTHRLLTEHETENSNIKYRSMCLRENSVLSNNTALSLRRRQTFSASNNHEILSDIARGNSGVGNSGVGNSGVKQKEFGNDTQNHPLILTQSISSGKTEPCMFRSTVPWSKRTETVARQVNRVRRPISNPAFENSHRFLREGRSPRSDYAVTRCVSSLPRLQVKRRANNSQLPTEDQFIEQVATSNTPRGR